MDGKTSETM